MKLFDAHCHVLSPEVIEHATAKGIVGFAVCGTRSGDWDNVFHGLEKMKTHEGEKLVVAQLLGIHPEFVSRDWKKSFMALEKMVRDFPKVGIGETGLDFREQFVNREEQEASFIAHLDLAQKMNRTVTIHCVKAWGRLIEILHEHPVPQILLHAFGGAVELIPDLIALNCWFSFGPLVMNPKAKRLRAAAAAVPEERLLIESDFSGEPQNEPMNLIRVALAIAELRNSSVEEIADVTCCNARFLFS